MAIAHNLAELGKPHKMSSSKSLPFKLKLIPFGTANIGDYFHVFRRFSSFQK